MIPVLAANEEGRDGEPCVSLVPPCPFAALALAGNPFDFDPGFKSWCLTKAFVRRLRRSHSKQIRKICRLTMRWAYIHRSTSKSPQQHTGVFELGHYLASYTLPWVGHVARMPKSRPSKRQVLPWLRAPRATGALLRSNLSNSRAKTLLPSAHQRWKNLLRRGSCTSFKNGPPIQPEQSATERSADRFGYQLLTPRMVFLT